MSEVSLREVLASDVGTFFEHQRDPEASRMAAFTASDPCDRLGYEALWTGLLANDEVEKRTILLGDQIAGNILGFTQSGLPAVGYWIDRRFWGRGVATQALRAFLAIFSMRPLYARIAHDNLASGRVLEKCGFTLFARERGFANARGTEIVELVYILRT